jgi:uncharacterized Tic20 family protein
MQDERTWAILCHLSALLMFLFPIFQIVAPLAIWLAKRDESSFIDAHGKESLNFQISMTIYTLVASISLFFCVGFVLVPALVLADVIFVIIASINANRGDHYMYPFTIRFIR